jgi:hypothetical protein
MPQATKPAKGAAEEEANRLLPAARRLSMLIACCGLWCATCFFYEVHIQRTPLERAGRLILTDLAMAPDLETIHTILHPVSSERGMSTRAILRVLVVVDVFFSMGAYLLAICAILCMRCFKIFSDRVAKIGVWLPCCAFLSMLVETTMLCTFLYAKEPTKADQTVHFLLMAAVRVKWLALFVNSGFLCYATTLHMVPAEGISLRSVPRLLGSKDAMVPTLFGFSATIGVVSTVVPSSVFLFPLAINITKGAWAATALVAAAFYLGFLDEEDNKIDEDDEEPVFGPDTKNKRKTE